MTMRMLATIGLALLLTACNSTPSEGDARAALESRIRGDIRKDEGASFRIERFAKTNGQELEVNGAKVYRLLFSARVVYPDGFHVECAPGGVGGLRCAMSEMDRMGRVSPQPMRARVDYSGEVVFQKFEKGWSPESVQLKQQSMEVMPPSEEELRAAREKQQSDIEQAIAACPRLVDEAGWQKIVAQGGTVPDANKVSVAKDGQLRWNNVAVDAKTLGQYLEQTRNFPTMPYLILSVEPGTDPAKVMPVKETAYRTGVCAAP